MDGREPRFRAEAIRELMDKEGLSQGAFARRVKVSRTLIGGWLSGWVQPGFRTVLRMCAEFSVAPSFFAEGLGDKTDE